MATINVQTGTGNVVTYTAASAGGDTVATGTTTRPVITIRNGSAGPVTVTLAGQNVCSQGFTHSVAYTCAVGDTEILPPASTMSNGTVLLAYSAATSVTVGAVAS